MNHAELEARVLSIVEAVISKQHVEDSRVELQVLVAKGDLFRPDPFGKLRGKDTCIAHPANRAPLRGRVRRFWPFPVQCSLPFPFCGRRAGGQVDGVGSSNLSERANNIRYS